MRYVAPWGIVSALMFSACGDGNGARPAPTPLRSSIEIAGPSAYLFLGQTYQFHMEARMSDGTRATTGGTWASDAPAIATVDGNGVVSVVGVGEATVYVDYQGQRATRRIRTTVLYEGVLDSAAAGGVVGLTRCTGTGWWSARQYCGSERMVATFTQQENVVTGVIVLVWDSDSFSETAFPPVTAVISPTGELSFESAGSADGDDVVTHWRLGPVGRTRIAGTFTVRITDPRQPGFLEWEEAIKPTSPAEQIISAR
jgi:hypothetical protein